MILAFWFSFITMFAPKPCLQSPSSPILLDHGNHVLWIDPKWCEREFGHQWDSDDPPRFEGATVLLTPGYAWNDGVMHSYPSGPCEGKNFVEHDHCKICKLKRTITHTCTNDVKEDREEEFEEPRKP